MHSSPRREERALDVEDRIAAGERCQSRHEQRCELPTQARFGYLGAGVEAASGDVTAGCRSQRRMAAPARRSRMTRFAQPVKERAAPRARRRCSPASCCCAAAAGPRRAQGVGSTAARAGGAGPQLDAGRAGGRAARARRRLAERRGQRPARARRRPTTCRARRRRAARQPGDARRSGRRRAAPPRATGARCRGYYPEVSVEASVGPNARSCSRSEPRDRSPSTQDAYDAADRAHLDAARLRPARAVARSCARQQLLAANFAFNRTMQDVVFAAQRAYFALDAAQGMKRAAEKQPRARALGARRRRGAAGARPRDAAGRAARAPGGREGGLRPRERRASR